MPAERGTSRLCDLIDHSIEVGDHFRQIVLSVIEDGIVTPAEHRLVVIAAREHEDAALVLPAPAAEIDGAMAAIGAIAGAGRVSDHAYRKTREAYEDTRQVASVA